jgi:hypothetical protein
MGLESERDAAEKIANGEWKSFVLFEVRKPVRKPARKSVRKPMRKPVRKAVGIAVRTGQMRN